MDEEATYNEAHDRLCEHVRAAVFAAHEAGISPESIDSAIYETVDEAINDIRMGIKA